MALLSYSIRRVLMLIPVLLGMSIVVFSIIRAIPGDPALTILGEKASPKAIEDLREVLGLNNPWYIQYFDYLKQMESRKTFMGLVGSLPEEEKRLW